MKKCTAIIASAALCAALALALGGCDPDEDARLIVRNDLGGAVARLTLSGDETTGDLLAGAVIEDGADGYNVPRAVTPGKYRWHAVTASALALTYDGATEIELFPGPNHIVLEQ